jgi:preprotein translocase subunit SecY
MLGGIKNTASLPELRRRLIFTFLMLAVYRIGVQIPTPGINGEALAAFFTKNAGTLFGMFNMFSGGALENFSIFALGIMPYISASIIIQLLTVVIPQLEALSKEGESGRHKITQYTRYGTVALSLIQSLFISAGLEGMSGPGGEAIVIVPGWQFKLMTIITLTSGTAFIMWLGEQMTERGILAHNFCWYCGPHAGSHRHYPPDGFSRRDECFISCFSARPDGDSGRDYYIL